MWVLFAYIQRLTQVRTYPIEEEVHCPNSPTLHNLGDELSDDDLRRRYLPGYSRR